MHSTDYTDTLILPAPDTRAETATAPPAGKRSIAELQYERLSGADYTWTSDDLIFDVHCARKGIGEADRAAERERFFSKGQPCLRTSPLTKTYGWAMHFDSGGRIALLPMGSDRLAELQTDPSVTIRTAMKSSR
ncbi:DUF6157 family protein [Dietzia cercidiphylli]|uniref:DUF6157 family protein n=1 Tax=Dietzia TaxID=37914 RepID=UPI0015F9927A|nr:DUF6157 family protein [Dietzia sp. B19]MBB1057751.1 hypothetical protein [Dietzia sp. B19]